MKLKRCPFCGAKAEFNECTDEDGSDALRVMCSRCPACIDAEAKPIDDAGCSYDEGSDEYLDFKAQLARKWDKRILDATPFENLIKFGESILKVCKDYVNKVDCELGVHRIGNLESELNNCRDAVNRLTIGEDEDD